MRPILSYSSYSRTATATGTGWSADYPAENVLNLARPTKVARGGTSLTIDLGSVVPVSFVGIVQHALASSETIQVVAGAYDSGPVSLSHQVSGWRQTTPFVFDEVTTDTVEITFSDGADIGGVEVGLAWELPYIGEGAQVGMLDAGQEIVLLGGVSLGTDALRLRTYDCEVPYLATTITEDIGWAFQQEMGLARPYVFVEDYDDPTTWSRSCFLATNAALPQINSQMFGLDKFSLRGVEIVR